MKKLNFFIFMFTLAVFTNSKAITNEGRYAYLGHGVDSCGKFNEAVRQGHQNESWAQWNMYQAYTYGYLSGVNRYIDDTYDIKGKIDMAGIMGNIEKYCSENPLKDYFDAISETQKILYKTRER